MTTTLTDKQLDKLARFVREHGFASIVDDGAVHFVVPYTSPQGNGYEAFEVRTFGEAREALGY
jgi:hypothetical protein